MFCERAKEYLSQKQIPFQERDVTKDPEVAELHRLGHVTTPVTVINEAVVVGFDAARIEAALRL